MSKNSNKTGAMLLLAIILGAITYAFTFFGSEVEQKNISASFAQTTTSTGSLLSVNKKSIGASLSSGAPSSEMSESALPSFKMSSTSTGNYAQSSNPDFPSTGVTQMDVQSMNQPAMNTGKGTGSNYAHSQTQSYAIGNTNVDYISNPQNPTKSDINALLLLDTHAAESAMSVQQGSKRATPALAAKTASASTSLSNKSASKKIGGSPGEPGTGGSLPLGDGVSVLLMFLLAYGVRKFVGILSNYSFNSSVS